MEKGYLEHLMKDADRYYCDRYSGMHGGYEATQLATYPFLHEVSAPIAFFHSPPHRSIDPLTTMARDRSKRRC